MAGGSKFDVNSSGFGDVRTTLLFKTHESKDWKNHLGFGLSLPTGSINKSIYVKTTVIPLISMAKVIMKKGRS